MSLDLMAIFGHPTLPVELTIVVGFTLRTWLRERGATNRARLWSQALVALGHPPGPRPSRKKRQRTRAVQSLRGPVHPVESEVPVAGK